MKDAPVPVARVRSLPPERSHGDATPDGVVLPLYGLYSPGQVAFATFFGTPLAGAWLLARNYKRLGQPGAGWLCVALATCVVAVMMLLAMAEILPGMVSIVTIPAALLVARALQGSTYDRHLSLGGKRISSWIAFGSAMACLGIVVVLAFGGGVLYVIATEAPSIEPASGSDIRYVDGASEQDAQRLGATLVESKYFEQPATVQVHRELGRVVVTFVVHAVAILDSTYHDAYAAHAEVLATKAFDGTPVDIVLADDKLVPKRRFRWEMRPRTLAIDEAEVRFRDGIEEKEARAVMRILRERKFLGKRSVVSLSRSGRVVLSVEFSSDVLEQPLLAALWHNRSHALSRDAFGGAPIDIRIEVEAHSATTLAWEKRQPESVDLEDGHEILYRDGGTLEEARDVAATLADFFKDGNLTTVVVSRDSAFSPPRAVVSFYATNPEYDAVAVLAEPLSKAVFANQPVEIRLIGLDWKAHTTFSWEKRPKATRSPSRPKP